MKPLGLIAGEGIFPLLVAHSARAAGRRVVCAAFAKNAWPDLKEECDTFKWVGILRMGQWVNVLRGAGCDEAIMVGRVLKTPMYDRWRYLRYIPDLRVIRMWFTVLRHDKRPYSILQAIAGELSSAGIQLIDSTKYCPEHLATAGVMTRRQPSTAQWRGIEYGWEIGSTLSRLDIGQSIAVLEQDVIAIEALEGTDAMIQRAGQLCKRGDWVLIKVGNTQQDMRVDVPTVGVNTIEKLRDSRAGCLVLEAGKTIMLEKQKVIELADRYKIAVVGYERK